MNALLIVDVQNDFCPGGALGVPEGDKIVPIVNQLTKEFEVVILTQDWHPAGHSSFASTHAGEEPYDTIEMPYGQQVLWPDHCVQDTAGSEFHPNYRPIGANSLYAKASAKILTPIRPFLKMMTPPLPV